MKIQTQVWLEIYLKQVLEKGFLHWGGRAVKDSNEKVPHHPFSLPHTRGIWKTGTSKVGGFNDFVQEGPITLPHRTDSTTKK